MASNPTHSISLPDLQKCICLCIEPDKIKECACPVCTDFSKALKALRGAISCHECIRGKWGKALSSCSREFYLKREDAKESRMRDDVRFIASHTATVASSGLTAACATSKGSFSQSVPENREKSRSLKLEEARLLESEADKLEREAASYAAGGVVQGMILRTAQDLKERAAKIATEALSTF